MNKFKKITVGIIVAAGVSCLGGAVACSGEAPDYYQLTFEGEGVEYVLRNALSSFESGGRVKEGMEVKFTLALDETTVGTPVIFLNDEEMSPDGEGVYSFIMDGDSVVKAEGLSSVFTVTLDRYESVLGSEGYVREERRIYFTDENGVRLNDEVRVPEGGSLKFMLDVSTYYVHEKVDKDGKKETAYTVRFDTEILEPDANGVYTLENVTANSTVSVSGLTQEESFATAQNESNGDGTTKYGTGTAEDPFKISKPIDLYYMAVLVNSDFYGASYNSRYYKLMNDIDMGGEQLFVIGDTSTSSAVFCGTFDGNGHTVSNFYITDEVIDQSTFENAYLPFVGMFGQVSATLENPAVIKNVKLTDYEVRVHPVSGGSSAFVGSLVGYGIGVQISGCEATTSEEWLKKGKTSSLVAFGDDNQMIYMGGLVGLLQAAYNESGRNVVAHNAFVSSCSTDILVQGLGSPRSMGGLVGYLVSSDESATASVVNSYSLGNVSGGMHSGGIVGTLARYSTVVNCYSSASVNASNEVDNPLLNEDFRGAYAGGIVGYAEEDTVVYGCYSANQKLSAYSVAFPDPKYTKTGEFVAGKREKGSISQETAEVVLFNNSKDSFENLGWSTNDWILDTDGLPVLKALTDGAQRTVSLIVKNGSAELVDTSRTGEGYAPIHVWYADANVELDEYIKSGEKRASWGYYFDEALTQKVPYGFVPVGNITLYTGVADYGEVAGRYYIKSTDYSDGAYFELFEDGTMRFRNGGMNFEGSYSYNGETKEITLYDTCFALLRYALSETNGSTVTLVGKLNGNGFTLSGKAVISQGTSSDGQEQTTTEDMSLTAVKAVAEFGYGEYYADNGSIYRFGEDGTGVYIGVDERLTFNFEHSGNALKITISGGGVWNATVAGGKVTAVNGTSVTAKNSFNGAWVMADNPTKTFTFDGIDSVTYADGEAVKTVKYSVSGGQATFTVGNNNFIAKFEDGVLKVNQNTCLVSNGFLGGWYMPGVDERIDIDLEGYGTDGFGYATISYFGGEIATLNAQYDVLTADGGSVLRLYVNDTLYGELLLDAATNSASGLFYSLNNGAYYSGTSFYPYDNFKGTWVSASERFDTVTFNGKTSDSTGEARLIYADNTSARGVYTLTSAVSGTLTVGTTVYAISFDFDNGTVSFEIESEGFTDDLARRDDWYGVVLYDGDVAYTFDGKGNTGEGKINISDGRPSLSYKFDGNGALVIENKPVTLSGGSFIWNGTTLVFKTGFAGRWLVAGTQKYLTVGEVQSDFNAAVSFEGESGSFKFSFDPSDTSLNFVQTVGNERVSYKLVRLGSNELSIERVSVSDSNVYSCISESGADSFMGTFRSGNVSWTFDGLGNCRYGDGTATYRAADGTETVYTYKINRVGMVYIRADGGQVFVPAQDGGFIRGEELTKYKIVNADAYYDRLATRAENGKNVSYVFDGVGGLWRESETGFERLYSYEIVSANAFTLTDESGKGYACRLSVQGKTTLIAFVEFDSYKGEYFAEAKDSAGAETADETGEGEEKARESWSFDGFGSCPYGTGTAIYTNADGVKTTYSYTINSTGVAAIVNDGIKLFTEVTEGGFKKDGALVGYDFVTPDGFYGDAKDSADSEYFCDGVGGLWCKVNEEFVRIYTYEIVSETELKLTDMNNKTYTGTITKEDGKTIIEIAEVE